MSLDYSHLKSVAAKCGLSPSEILALAPANDPFYVGAKGQLTKGKWFASIYEQMGSPTNCHIRRVHYWLVTHALAKPDGKVYENTQNDWNLLTLAAKYARYLGLVPIENIVDRRAPDPHVNYQFWKDQDPNQVKGKIDAGSIIDQIVNEFYCYNPSSTQPYMIECWSEKSTMNDVLVPLCREYGLNLVTGLGELSISAVYLLVQRIVTANKPVRIFYISDFDPCGENMPVSVARKIEYFSRQYQQLAQSDIKLFPLMLTYEQCKEYDLPRSPIRDAKNDHPGYTKRKEKFENRYGAGATELDALEALYPGRMRELVIEATEPFFDQVAWDRARELNGQVQDQVRKYLSGGVCPECEGRGVLDPDQISNVSIGSPYNLECGFCDGTGQIKGKIDEDLLAALEFETSNYQQVIRSSNGSTPSLDWLYESGLDYLDQLEKYRRFRNKDESGVDDMSRDTDKFK